MSDPNFTFNWHERGEDFIKWLTTSIVSMISTEEFNHLSDLTEKWTNVDLQVTINGVPIPTEKFLERMDQQMAARAERQLKQWFEEFRPTIDLEDFVYDITRAVKEQVLNRAAKFGIDLDEGY